LYVDFVLLFLPLVSSFFLEDQSIDLVFVKVIVRLRHLDEL